MNYKTHYNPEDEKRQKDRLLKIVILLLSTLFIWMIIFAIVSH